MLHRAAEKPREIQRLSWLPGHAYVSSVQNGGVSRIRPGRPAELIAKNIPSAASVCYDAGAKQLVIRMNANNGIAFLRLK